jgi:hypothetical protein
MNEHGGKREGAGRPRAVSALLRDDKIKERHLRIAAEKGWEALAEEYPSLMRIAVAVASGQHDETGRPNVPMLKTLLELMVKVTGTEPNEKDSAIKALVEAFRDRLSETDSNRRPAVDGDTNGRTEHPNGGHATWPTANPPVPGMGNSP